MIEYALNTLSAVPQASDPRNMCSLSLRSGQCHLKQVPKLSFKSIKVESKCAFAVLRKKACLLSVPLILHEISGTFSIQDNLIPLTLALLSLTAVAPKIGLTSDS